jgi:hypothetical protein
MSGHSYPLTAARGSNRLRTRIVSAVIDMGESAAGENG